MLRHRKTNKPHSSESYKRFRIGSDWGKEETAVDFFSKSSPVTTLSLKNMKRGCGRSTNFVLVFWGNRKRKSGRNRTQTFVQRSPSFSDIFSD